MAIRKLLGFGLNGILERVLPVVQSRGTADAGMPVALNTVGKLDATVLPSSSGNITIADNLTTDDPDQVLSARQGTIIQTMLGSDINNTIDDLIDGGYLPAGF